MTTTLQQHGKQCGVIIKKTCFYLPVRRHDFGSLVEGDTLWTGVAFCLQMRWSMDFVSRFCDMMIGPGRDFKLKDISIVMSLSLHCQNCKKCRRRVVVTLPPHCHHIAATSPPHRRHIAATSTPHRRHIAANVAAMWRQCGGNVAAMWRRCGGDAAAMWRQCGGDVAAMWRRCGGDVAAMCRRCDGDVVAMWRRCDGDVVAMWRQCGDAVLTKSRQLSYRKTMIACPHIDKAEELRSWKLYPAEKYLHCKFGKPVLLTPNQKAQQIHRHVHSQTLGAPACFQMTLAYCSALPLLVLAWPKH